MAGCGGCVNCGGKCSKKSGWTPVKYYIMYEVIGYVGMGSCKSIKRVELLKNAVNEERARIEAGKWLRRMKKKKDHIFGNARLVASTHKNILELI